MDWIFCDWNRYRWNYRNCEKDLPSPGVLSYLLPDALDPSLVHLVLRLVVELRDLRRDLRQGLRLHII